MPERERERERERRERGGGRGGREWAWQQGLYFFFFNCTVSNFCQWQFLSNCKPSRFQEWMKCISSKISGLVVAYKCHNELHIFKLIVQNNQSPEQPNSLKDLYIYCAKQPLVSSCILLLYLHVYCCYNTINYLQSY